MPLREQTFEWLGRGFGTGRTFTRNSGLRKNGAWDEAAVHEDLPKGGFNRQPPFARIPKSIEFRETITQRTNVDLARRPNSMVGPEWQGLVRAPDQSAIQSRRALPMM
jgi:hypothetical protein